MAITKQINITAHDGKAAELHAMLMNVARLSAEERGCLYYFAWQQGSEENFIIIESWVDQDSLDAHKKTAHFLEFKENLSLLVKDKSSENLTFMAGTPLDNS